MREERRGHRTSALISRMQGVLAGVARAHPDVHSAQQPQRSAEPRGVELRCVDPLELDEARLAQTSAELAALLVEQALREETGQERARRKLLQRLVQDGRGQAFTTLFTDRVFRDSTPSAVVDAARQLLRRWGVPEYLPALARMQMQALLRLGPFMPGLAARSVLARLRQETAAVVLSAEEAPLSAYLARRKSQGVRVNLNLLGEAVLGEREAAARLQQYLELLARPDVDAISVKISSVCSQVDLVAWDATLALLSARLTQIYRCALAHQFTDAAGRSAPKLVNLDMEAYRDVELTVAAFKRALDADELLPLSAGIALQAYLPESYAILCELTAWAQARCARGGAPIRVRLVKGANLLAERAEASARGLAVPTFASKAEVDANFKRMLEYAFRPEHTRCVHIGVASHNAFDVALALALREHYGTQDAVSFEVLEGMAGPLERALGALSGQVLVYAPVVEPKALHSAIAYLMRRLDESTAPENYLSQSLSMRAGDAAFEDQRARFEAALRDRDKVAAQSPRATPPRAEPVAPSRSSFVNAPDTDFTRADERARLHAALASAMAQALPEVTSRIGGQPVLEGTRVAGFDPSRPGATPYSIALARPHDLERALDTAERAAPRMAAMPIEERAALLAAVAAGLRSARHTLTATMVLDAGKRAEQADAEVSEAIDFAEYYAESFARVSRQHPELALRPQGLGVVTPPWNFPLAIPAGGVFALLMSGHPVLLKPALETPLVAQRLCEACWEAGVPSDALQLLVCEDGVGGKLVRDIRVGRVLLTGSSDTARMFQGMRPGLSLMAETGGKNAIVVTARADRDAAIADVVTSAFGHAGQKCSAASLLVLEDAVYRDKGFLRALRDAAASLPVGPAWDPRSVVTPLVQPPAGPLLRALSTLEEGERWLLQPFVDEHNPRLCSPGIKLGVQEGSFTHQTELFGPLLAVMRARDLDHALEIANATPYGLTAGLHSLDEGEQVRWMKRMRAGNLYINRGITGAIVQRQPFGGTKASSFGPGAKAGGPNYVLQLCAAEQLASPAITCPPVPAAAELVTRVRKHLDASQRERLGVGACSYGHAYAHEFGIDHDPSAVLGERNVLRYLPCQALWMRAGEGADVVDVLLALAAARTVGARVALSVAPQLAERAPWLVGAVQTQTREITACIEDTSAFLQRMMAHARTQPIERLRVVGPGEPFVGRAAEAVGAAAFEQPVLLTGRVELLAYVREQSISARFHRFGSLAAQELLPPLRRPPAPSA